MPFDLQDRLRTGRNDAPSLPFLRPSLPSPVPTTVEPDAPFTLLDAWPSFERSRRWSRRRASRPFTLLDAWPSFERTPADNVWRGGDD